MNKNIHQCLSEGMFLPCYNTKRPKHAKGQREASLLTYEEANKKLIKGETTIAFFHQAKRDQIINIDCDSFELSQACDQLLPKTYVEKSPTSNSYHYFYKISEPMENLNIKSGDKHLGEIKSDNVYSIIYPSLAISKEGKLNPYTILNEADKLPVVTPEQVRNVLLEFMSPEDATKSETKKGELSPELKEKVLQDPILAKLFNGDIAGFASRSEAELSLVNKLRARNYSKEDAFKVLFHSKIGKIREKPISYWEMMWEKALEYVTGATQEVIEQKISEVEELDVLNCEEILKHKPSKNYIIQEVIFPKTSTMISAPSRAGKSLHALYQGICIASGKKYLDKFKVKKKSVLYVCAEDTTDVFHTRFKQIKKGLAIRSKKIKFYLLTREKTEDLLDPKFKARLFKTIKEKKVEVLIIDTINPVTPSLDDNKARDVTYLFNSFIKPVVDILGVHIQFLHHTDKAGNQYLGSMKWLANVDQAFRIDRKGLDNNITIYNEKAKGGETSVKNIEMNFEPDKITFKLLSENEASVYSKKEKMTRQEFFLLKLNELCKKSMKRKEIIDIFTDNGVIFSKPTLDRALKEWKGGKNE